MAQSAAPKTTKLPQGDDRIPATSLSVREISARPLPRRKAAPVGVIIGRYSLFSEIGSGGMASVHIGRMMGPAGFSRTVAIKRLYPQFAQDPQFVGMFLDEANLSARVQHPNVVSILDVVATDGEMFLVMEYIRGESLSRLLREARARNHSVSPEVTNAILIGVLHGLHAAHTARSERGEALELVHRDVSPQNILVGIDGIPRVVDFGVAKAEDRNQSTREGQLKGKLDYMAPEQLEGAAATHKADIYSASVVMWEALTGRRLLGNGSVANKVAAILSGKTPRPRSVRADIPEALDDIVMRGLARDPSERFDSAQEMAVALERALPCASPVVVGRWVQSVAHAALQRREEQISSVEKLTRSTAEPSVLRELVARARPAGAKRAPALAPSLPSAEDTTGTGMTRGGWVSPLEPKLAPEETSPTPQTLRTPPPRMAVSASPGATRQPALGLAVFALALGISALAVTLTIVSSRPEIAGTAASRVRSGQAAGRAWVRPEFPHQPSSEPRQKRPKRADGSSSPKPPRNNDTFMPKGI